MADWNWSRNLQYRSARLHEPRTLDELRAIVAGAERVKVLGTRHSFNDVADTTGDQVSLRHFDRVLEVNASGATVEAGVNYGALAQPLHQAGYALHNLASLPHISVAGACATATHGSGDRNGNLATAVSAVEFVTSDGAVTRLSRGDAHFTGAIVSLGAMGVVTRLTLDVEPSFAMRQTVYERLPFDALLAHFDQITSAAYSVSFFTDCRAPTINQAWLKQRMQDGAPAVDLVALGATPARRDVHPIVGMPERNCTAQMGMPGPWHDRLPHFRMAFTPSSGEELQSEYFVPRHHAIAALRAIDAMRDRIALLLQICEIRTIAADELWLSPCSRQACVAIHFTWKKTWPGVSALLPRIEAALSPFEARPHWGKLFTMAPTQLQQRYAKLADFRELVRTYDPRGAFRNAFLDRYIFGAPRRVDHTAA